MNYLNRDNAPVFYGPEHGFGTGGYMSALYTYRCMLQRDLYVYDPDYGAAAYCLDAPVE